jgi:Cu(I)/Ag(I) efflux system membrane fusion protein
MNIKKGESLYTIYSSDIASIKAEIEIAKDLNKNLYDKANSKLENFDIKNAKFLNNEVVVSSPISGIITQKNVNNKSYVEKGKTLFQISSLEDIWFIASIYQEDLSFIKANMNSIIKLDGVEDPIVAKVDFIYPVFNEEKKTVDIRFVIENSENKILPSMFGKVKIEKESKEILVLPKSAVIKKSNSYYVFIPKENGEFTPKKIEAKRVTGEKDKERFKNIPVFDSSKNLSEKVYMYSIDNHVKTTATEIRKVFSNIKDEDIKHQMKHYFGKYDYAIGQLIKERCTQ